MKISRRELLAASALPLMAQTREQVMPLRDAKGLELWNAAAQAGQLQGRAGLRLVADKPVTGMSRLDHLALVEGVEFHNGVIEVQVAGEPAPGAEGGARGFVGLAFRVQEDKKTYDCFYVRPTNGRAEDQERRNHAVQYISHPTYTWSKLRAETPSRYEVYADMQPGQWISLRIEVEGAKARLFVNQATQPTLIVNDLKTGADAKGRVALWFEGSTIAHYADLKIRPA